jgi:alanyl aminopeptidase
VASAAALACGSGTPRTPLKTVPTPPPPVAPAPGQKAQAAQPASLQPPTLRLPELARPKSHVVDLVLDPSSQDFTGTIQMAIEILQPTDHLWLSGDEITVSQATLTVGGETLALGAHADKEDFLALTFPKQVEAGPATLTIKYAGKIHPSDGTGIYTAQEAGDWYLFTQFESTDARSAFPCFDEPSYKAPWQLTIHAKKDQAVFSNTPIEQETDEPNGMKATRFAVTKPLPSYLIAFAVGPFETVDAGKTKSGVPVRIVVPRGRAGDVEYPAKVTGRLLDLLEDYFGIPYPFGKLDIMAVAVFNAGAMENPGLITYRQEIVLTKPGEMTVGKQQRYADVTAHELAHQWFGDLVTLAWWDDTWLNEAFASWAGAKVMATFAPEWDPDVSEVGSKSRVMQSDSLESARSIHNEIKQKGDIENSFDGITYAKGEAVLDMLERWVGPEQWQKGVRAYLTKHAYGNATYDDFVGAIADVAGPEVKAAFDTFVRQSGVPEIDVSLVCEKGQPPRLDLEQKRYVPIGADLDTNRLWSIPVCARWSAGGKTGRACTLLAQKTGQLPLEGAKACPEWVLPNEGGFGYYRALAKGDLLERLLKKGGAKITTAERVNVIGDLDAFVRSGAVPVDVTLGLVQAFSKDANPHIVGASARIVAGIDEVVPAELRPNYRRFIIKLYKAKAKALGWTPKAGEDEETKSLRGDLLELVANEGNDPELAKQATLLAYKWLDDRKAVHPELVGTVLSIATYHGDRKLFDRLHDEAKKAKDRGDRGRLLGALGDFTDPDIVQAALGIVLTDEFPLREATGIMQGGFRHPQTRAVAYEWIKAHFDDVASKVPSPFRKYLAFSFVAICDDGKRPEVEAAFKSKIEAFDGGQQVFAQAMEALSQCAASRKATAPGVIAFLKKQ